jgi:hypothetical protein
MSVHYTWRPPEAINEQLRLAHELRQELIRVRLAYEDDLKAIWSSFPAVATAEEKLAKAEADHAAVTQTAKDDRARTGRRVVRSQAEVVAAAALRTCRQERRAAIGEVRDAAAARRAARTAHYKAEHRSLYHKYVQVGGLFWATWNDVMRQHLGAVKRLRQRRLTHPTATLAHRPYTGSATIAVQLIRKTGAAPRTPAVVADPNGRYRNYLVAPWIDPHVWEQMSSSQRRHAGRVALRFRYGRDADNQLLFVDLPVQQHRQLPADADITGARLTVRQTSVGPRASVSISANVPDPPRRRPGPAVAVHLGWRRVDGGILAATWRSTRRLQIPAELRTAIAFDTPLTGRLIVPAAIGDAFQRADDTRSQRDQAVNSLKKSVAAWLMDHPPIPHPFSPGVALEAEEVGQWRSANKFAELAAAWAANPPPGADAESLVALLHRWWRRDKKLRTGPEQGRRRHAAAARDDLYRRFAALLADQAARIVVDDISLPTLNARSIPRPRPVHQKIARRRLIVAPGRLRRFVTVAAAREGAAVAEVASVGLSRIHGDGCGYENPGDNRYEAAVVRCDGCGQLYDPDHSATALMLARARRGSAD